MLKQSLYTERDSKIERETEKLISSSVSSVLSVVEKLCVNLCG